MEPETNSRIQKAAIHIADEAKLVAEKTRPTQSSVIEE
jgi:hypothetical protein